MADFGVTDIGEIDDRVRLNLGGDEILICESYEVKISVFTQPAAWAISVGHASVAAQILERYPAGTKFELFVGSILQQTGVLESRASRGTGGTTVSLRGRDALAPLHDDHMDAELSFNDATFVTLAQKQLEAVGLGDRAIAGSNRANRKIRAGVPLVELAPPRTVDQILLEADNNAAATGAGGAGIAHTQIQAHLNEKRYEFILRHLQTAGLFFWAAADGTFVLSEPNANQKPMSSIIRRVGQSRLDTNVVDHDFSDDTTHRYATYSVYGRGAGKKNGHPKALGVFVDDEMTNLGFRKNKVWRAQNARTRAQAEFLARRMCAEDRRAGWQLRYTMAGHTTPFTGGQRAVWTPDTVVLVDDDITGIKREMYVADVTFRRNPQSTTDLVLMRPEDLVFGPSEF